MNKAVFLDRDGTVNEEVGYLTDLSRLRLIAGAGAAIKRLNHAGYKVILVTNQSGVARGYFPES
jgi:D-glycero-D-manno-heptose 1,7-bisphosphate phosphatase